MRRQSRPREQQQASQRGDEERVTVVHHQWRLAHNCAIFTSDSKRVNEFSSLASDTTAGAPHNKQ